MRAGPVIGLILVWQLGPATAIALQTGEPAPDFSLTAAEGQRVSLRDYGGRVVVLEWFNSGCPFVQNQYRGGRMQGLQARYTQEGVVWLTINSTGSEHANFLTNEQTAQTIEEWGLRSSAVLLDPDGAVGKLYQAKTTPHLFIVDAQGVLAYQGAIDDTPSASADPAEASNYVAQALDQLLAGQPVSVPSTTPYGCSIKYAD